MSTLSMRYPQDTQQHLHGWAASFLIHGIAVALSVALVASLRLPPEPKVFKWEVAIVETPSPVPFEQAAPADPLPAPTAPTPIPPRPVKAQPPRVEPRQVVQTVERVEAVQPVRSVEPVIQQEVRSATPIMHERLATTEPAPRQSAPVVNRPVQSVEAAPQTLSAAHETMTVVESSPIPLAPERQVVAVAPVVRQEAKSEIPVAAAATATVSRPVLDMASVPTGKKEHKPSSKDVVAKAAPPAAIEKGALKEIPLRSAPATRPDFGWLAEALWKSVEQRKGYPRQARIDHIEGKVTLRMVLKGDGQVVDLVDLGIEESSGYPVLDRHALEVVRKAFPLELKHPLGQPQILVHLPMTYRLDQAR